MLMLSRSDLRACHASDRAPLPVFSAPNPRLPTFRFDDPIALVMAEIGEACGGPAAADRLRRCDGASHPARAAYRRRDSGLPAGRIPRPARRLLCPPHHCQRSRRPFHAARDRLGAGTVQPAARPRYLVRLRGRGEHPDGDAVRLRRRPQQSGPAGVSLREPGYACFAPAGLDQIHRLGNAGDVPAISIHAYGVEGSRVGTHVNRLMDVAE